jgi:hypothetical protein
MLCWVALRRDHHRWLGRQASDYDILVLRY